MEKYLLFFAIFVNTSLVRAQQKERMQTAASSGGTNNAAIDLFNKGVEYSNDKQYEKGIRCYERAIALDSGYVDAYNNLGLDFFETNILDSAAYYLHISLRKRPVNVVALTNLGLVEEKQGNLTAALGHFQQIEKLEPENPEGYYNSAGALIDLGKVQEGLAEAQRAEKLFAEAHSPSLPDCHYLILIAYFNLHDKPNAKKYFDLCKKENVQIDPQITSVLQ